MLKQHRLFIPGIILLIILIASMAGYFLAMPIGDELPASVQIAPQGEFSGQQVQAQTVFVLNMDFSSDEKSIREMLDVNPPMQYNLTGSGKSWQLQPRTPLAGNTVYTFRVNNGKGTAIQSFAFQTKSDLLIFDTYPMDQEEGIDVNSGIEINFNKAGVDLSSGFEILPAISGRFETKDYSSRFIPDQPLEPDSIYRVTIRAGVMSVDGSKLEKERTFSFETASKEEDESRWDNLTLSGNFSVTLLPGDEGKVPIRGGGTAAQSEYVMTLHKYPGIKTYSSALRERDAYYASQYGKKETYAVNTQGLETVMETTGKLISSEKWDLLAPLPSNLSEGYYLFTLSGEDSKGRQQFVQQMIQAVNLSVYTQSVEGDTLFWINDPVTGSAVAGALLELEDVKTGKKQAGEIQSDGLMHITTGATESAYATVVRDDTPLWFGEVRFSTESEKKPLSESFYTALYTDREIYQPGDEIQFWGVLRPRHITATMPDRIHMSIGTDWPESSLSKIEVSVEEDGTFSGVLSPGDLKQGYYSLALGDAEGGRYYSKYMQISEYTKPAYVIEATTDKAYYYFGDIVEYQVSATYFDGTPAAGVKLSLNCYEAGVQAQEVKLNEKGKASIKSRLDPSVLKMNDGSVASWQPNTVYWNVSSADGQDVVVNQSAQFIALGSRIAAYAETLSPGTIKVGISILDENKVEKQEHESTEQTEFERLKGAPTDIPAKLIVHKISFLQNQTGSYYDYVNKKTVPTYTVKSEETIDRVLDVKTIAGQAIIEELPYKEEGDNVFYWYELRFAGGVYGDVCETVSYISPYLDLYSDKEYTFYPEDSSTKKINEGEAIKIGLYENGVAVPNNGRVLYTAVQSQVLAVDTYEQETAELSMEESYLPNFYLVGAYFDGRHVYQMSRLNVVYGYQQKTLQVQAKTDKQEYRPGESVKVNLEITDSAGAPVTGMAAVGVVDEAVFAVQEQQLNFAEQFFGAVYNPNIVSSVSYENSPNMSYRKEGSSLRMESSIANPSSTGGGQGIEIRSDFADTAAFETVQITDGKAELTVALPDNVTTWRITAAAVAKDMMAGDGVSAAAATLPFYLQPIVAQTYLLGDDISISALAVGTALAQDPISYNAVLYDKSGNAIGRHETQTEPGERAIFNFGKQEKGAYKAVLTGTMGTHSDGIEVSFSVGESGLIVPVLKTMPLASLSNVESMRYPVAITIFDEEIKPRMDVLTYLTAQSGARTEQIAASYRAQVLYNELLPAGKRQIIYRDTRLEQIQDNNTGGVRPLPNAGPDPAVTARMLFGAPELIHKGQATAYLRQVLQAAEASPRQRLMAYAGLAAAKEPVLLDLKRLLSEQGEKFDAVEQLYLGAAFASLGDFTSARDIYKNFEKSVQRESGLYYLDGVGTEESRLETTAGALLLTSLISHEDAAGYQKYFIEQDNVRSRQEVSPYYLELLASVRAVTPASHGGGRFTYVDITKEVQDISMAGKGIYTLLMDGISLQNARFKPVSGKLYATVAVVEPMKNAPTGNEMFTVTKTYETADASDLATGGQVKVTVKVKFNENAPYGTYNFTDAIPSGLRWLPTESNRLVPYRDSLWASISNEGQTVRGSIYRIQPQDSGVEPVGGAPLIPRAALPIPISADYMAIENSIPETDPIALEKKKPNTDEIENTDIDTTSDQASEDVADSKAETDPTTVEEEGEKTINTESDAQEKELENGTTIESDQEATKDEIMEPVQEPKARSITQYFPSNETPDPNEYTMIYYLSAALPGTFITESVYVAQDTGASGAISQRGLITVSEKRG